MVRKNEGNSFSFFLMPLFYGFDLFRNDVIDNETSADYDDCIKTVLSSRFRYASIVFFIGRQQW